MALVTVNDLLAKAIDTCDAKMACRVVDMLRAKGMTYDDILSRVQSVRPDFDQAAWDALLYDGDGEED